MNKEEAASFLGVSVRTLQRYTESGKLPFQYHRGPKGTVAFFDPAVLEKFKGEMSAMTPGDNRSVMTVTPSAVPAEPGAPNIPSIPASHSAKFAAHFEPVPTVPPEIFDRLTAAMETIAAASRPAIGDGSPGEEPEEEKKVILPPSELAFKLLLDLDEVSALTGLAKSWLYHQIRDRKLPFITPTGKKFMIKRAALDQFIEGLE